MTPKITFKVSAKENLFVRIKIHGLNPGIYNTGIFCPRNKFDLGKQISGWAVVQNFMNLASQEISKLYLTGMTAETLWNEFKKTQIELMQTHTVQDAFEYYFQTKAVRKSTMDNKETLLAQLKKQGFAKKLIKDMNGAAYREFIQKLKVSDSSSHAVYVRLNTVLGHYIQENSLGIELPRGLFKAAKPKESAEDEFLTWDEMQKLLAVDLEDKNEQFYVDLFCLMSLTGMSIGDAIKFKPATHISADQAWFKYTRKKTDSNCVLPFLPVAKKIVERNKWPVKVSARTIQTKCEGLISDLVGRKIKSHGARKTFGTICLFWGYSIESVAKFMGHSDPSVTAKIYAKVTEAKIQREMSSLPQAVKEMMGV